MKKIKWLIWILVLALIGVGIWFWKFREEKPQIVLETVHPEKGEISTSITATGTVQPVDTVAVGTQVSGTIKKIYVDFNSTVKKGQLLAQLDKSLLLAQVQQFNAALQQAKSNLVYQESTYSRQKQLFDVGAISKADLETATNQYNVARDNVNGTTAQLQSAQKNLSYADIYSPIDGTVLSRNISEGQTVASSFNTPTLFTIAKDLTKMQVRASIDEADIGNVENGQRATFTVDAFPDKTFDGTVEEIRLQSAVSANVVTYVTIIDAPNGDMKLKPGMTANITVYTKDIPDALIIPSKAISFRPDSIVAKIYEIDRPAMHDRQDAGKSKREKRDSTGRKQNQQAGDDSVKHAFVWVKNDSIITGKRITTGLNNETDVQVIAGLTPNDVVVTGYQALKKGSSKKTTEKSPFLPQRPGNNRRTAAAPPR